MKILYVADDRAAAGTAARTLSGLGPDLSFTWARTLGAALHWIDANRDAAALIVEAAVQTQSSASFVQQVRSRSLTTAVVVVLRQPADSPDALSAGADGYVVAGAVDTDLRRVVLAAIERERARQAALAEKLAEIEAARHQSEEERQEVDRRHEAELSAASARLAEIEARHKASLSREARISTALQERLLELEASLRDADERRAAEAVASSDQLTTLHAEFTSSLANAAQWRDTLATKLAEATAALDHAQRDRKADALAAAEQLAHREAELARQLAAAVTARTVLERALADAEAAHRDAQQRAAADLAAAIERQAALEDLLSQESDRRTMLEGRLAESESALQEADRRYAAEQTSAAMRFADLQSRYDAALDTHTAARAALEQQLADAIAARQQMETRAAAESNAAAERAADLIARLSTESETRATLERDFAASRAQADGSRRRLLHVASTHRRRSRELKTRLEAQLASAFADAERQLGARDAELREMQLEREGLQASLGSTRDELQAVRASLQEEHRANERARATSQSEFQRLSAEYDHVRHSLAQLQESFNTLEHVAREHALERARLESVVAERESQLSAEAARHLAVEQAGQDALAQLQERLRQAVDTSGSEIARLQGAVERLQRELEGSRREATTLRADAEQVPGLRRQLETSRHERRRQFERAPFGLCRCTADGVILEANHALAALLGRRRGDELRSLNFAAAVSDRAGDLGWIIERTRATRKTETVETYWKRKDGRHLFVRVQATGTADDAIEIVVEDITNARALKERLRQGERMEAVGRLAAEVSATCDALLRDVIRDGRDWLATLGDEALRHRGELLLTDVTRAASFVRQLGVYGEKQAAAAPVSVQRVIRDLSPVLKRVVGDDIDLVLPKASGSYDVEVDAERLERVLVTLAGYARERMPHGGQVRIDLASAIVGRRFVSAHPSVRPGPHVVVTIAEVPRVSEGTATATDSSIASEKPGMDLRALGDVIGQCGGHLWMDAEPGGNMIVKIHLPSRAGAEPDAGTTETREGRTSRFARWFRTTSSTAVNS